MDSRKSTGIPFMVVVIRMVYKPTAASTVNSNSSASLFWRPSRVVGSAIMGGLDASDTRGTKMDAQFTCGLECEVGMMRRTSCLPYHGRGSQLGKKLGRMVWGMLM